MGFTQILMTTAAGIAAQFPSTGQTIKIPTDSRHGFELSCGSYRVEATGPSYAFPPKGRSESKPVKYSRAAISAWQDRTISKFGRATLTLKPMGCPSNVMLLIYASDPETFEGNRLSSTSCPPRSCIPVMQDRQWCSDPSRRAEGKVTYRLLKDGPDGLIEKTISVDFDVDNRAYFSGPAKMVNPTRYCPLPKH